MNDNRPIHRDRKPVVFTSPSLAQVALDVTDCGAREGRLAPKEVYAIYDFADAVTDLQMGGVVEDSELLNCCNLLLDFCNSLDLQMPEAFLDTIGQVADHLTFENNLTSLFERSALTREDALRAFYGCLGYVVGQMTIVTGSKSLELPPTNCRLKG